VSTPHSRTATDPVSEMSCFLVSILSDDGQIPESQSVWVSTHRGQNLLESIWNKCLEIHMKFNRNCLYSPTKQAIQTAFTATSDVHMLDVKFMLLQTNKLKHCSMFYSLIGDICVRGCKCYFRSEMLMWVTLHNKLLAMTLLVYRQERRTNHCLDSTRLPGVRTHSYETQPSLSTA
jgi:hypothetical protein